ncbi:nucleoside-diphosphate-sugar epimerase [Motilibacter peucedani]|uniref:Nucleoside-diphosphate-sugar epimerase n=1 Tax=Motilibacter peucedani TaxID=598650 RepID=A0A420XK92_9ACTN|nr:NAD-dependent epimerase/dehydratase family protein [Motilibacter peucedani]RKS68046.1 nucleoside-diphosphate-sugar epimerase [Motilibacter peucedani]
MRIAVIGGTGHIGTYLVPRLAAAGHEVVSLSRGQREPYSSSAWWSRVETVQVDRDAEDAAGTFGRRVAELDADVVVDLLCFTLDSARQLTDALEGSGTSLLHCGTIWVHGPSSEVPAVEDQPLHPTSDYGRAKAEVEEHLLTLSRRGRLSSTVIRAGHITGPGWAPIGPAGNLELDVFGALARGEEVVLPNFGLEALHHVHAADVAQAFALCVEAPEAARSQAFHVVAERAVTLRGLATAVASWFGAEPRLRFAPFDEFADEVGADVAAVTLDHISRSPVMSIEKARRALGYAPRWTALEAVHEALVRLVADGLVDTGGRTPATLP